MNKVFSVASWNVEHFRNSAADPERVQRVANFLAGDNGGPEEVPDIFALYEIEGKEIFQEFMHNFPDHHFHLTEGKETQEIFIGVHRNLQSFSTQRLEFKTGREYQRPGLLLSIRVDHINYSLLFLHIRSGRGTEDFGLRDAAMAHAFNLKKALDKVSETNANFIFLGDLNTMGIDDPAPYSTRMNLSATEEEQRIALWSKRREMTLLKKETTRVDNVAKEVTWYNGSVNYKPTNLDHVIASNHMEIRNQSNQPGIVSILGWPKLPQDQWPHWLSHYSDHALLYFEVWQ